MRFYLFLDAGVSESSPRRQSAWLETFLTDRSAATGYIWNHDFLPHCLTGLRCYILGFPQCWRSCLKPPSSVPCPALDRRPGYRPAAAASAPPPLMPELLNWGSSMPLRTARRSAPRPAPPRSAPTARKLKVPWSWRSSWRRMVSALKQPVTSRFQVLPGRMTCLTLCMAFMVSHDAYRRKRMYAFR